MALNKPVFFLSSFFFESISSYVNVIVFQWIRSNRFCQSVSGWNGNFVEKKINIFIAINVRFKMFLFSQINSTRKWRNYGSFVIRSFKSHSIIQLTPLTRNFSFHNRNMWMMSLKVVGMEWIFLDNEWMNMKVGMIWLRLWFEIQVERLPILACSVSEIWKFISIQF